MKRNILHLVTSLEVESVQGLICETRVINKTVACRVCLAISLSLSLSVCVCTCVCVYVCACTEALDEDDDVPFTDKKKSKIKLPFSTKKIMKNVGLKDKDKTSKEKSTKEPVVKPVIQEPVARVQHTPSAEIQAKMQDSEEWKAFQAMQDRISQVVSQTSEKVSQMEQGFENELSKLDMVQTTSPWAVLGVDGVAASPPTVKSPGDKEDQKNVSWVGFEDAFDAAAEDTDDATALPADDQQADRPNEEVNSNQQVDNYSEQVGPMDNSPDDVLPPPPADNDVITRHSAEPASQPEPIIAAETGSDNDGVAMVTNNTETVTETTPTKQEEQAPLTTRSESPAVAEEAETVDPFDVSNVVTAMSSGKPIFEVLSKEEDRSAAAAAKQQTARKSVQERRERDRQITAVMIGADDSDATTARSRPRPRPQAAVKSANPTTSAGGYQVRQPVQDHHGGLRHPACYCR